MDRLFREGEYLYEQGRYKEAIREFKSILEFAPDNRFAQDYIKQAEKQLRVEAKQDKVGRKELKKPLEKSIKKELIAEERRRKLARRKQEILEKQRIKKLGQEDKKLKAIQEGQMIEADKKERMLQAMVENEEKTAAIAQAMAKAEEMRKARKER